MNPVCVAFLAGYVRHNTKCYEQNSIKTGR